MSIVEEMIRQEGKQLNDLLRPRGFKVISGGEAGRYVVYQCQMAKQVKAEDLTKLERTIAAQATQWRTKWGLNYDGVTCLVDERALTVRMSTFNHAATQFAPQVMDAGMLRILEKTPKWHINMGWTTPADHPTSDTGGLLSFDLTNERSWGWLVTGQSGFGKTSMLKSAMMDFLNRHGPDEVLFILVDIESKSWGQWEGLPQTWFHATTMYQAIEALKHVRRRFKQEEWKRRIVLLLEEVQSFTLAAESSHARKLFMTVFGDIMTRGREWGVHPIVTTQHPNRGVIPTMMRDQFTVRTSMHQVSAEAAKMALASGHAEPLELRNPGDFVTLAPALWGPDVVHGYGYVPDGFEDAKRKWLERWPTSNEVHVIDDRYRKGFDPELLRLLEEYDTGTSMRYGHIEPCLKRLAFKHGAMTTHKGNNYQPLKKVLNAAIAVYMREADPETLPSLASDDVWPGDEMSYGEMFDDWRDREFTEGTHSQEIRVGHLRFEEEK